MPEAQPSQPNQLPPQSEAPAEAETQPRTAIDALPEMAGFVETAELGALRGQLVEAMAAGSAEVPELVSSYQALAEAMVDSQEGEARPRAQIGLIVQMALVRRDAGRLDGYEADLRDAFEYAYNMGFDDVAAKIMAAIAELKAEMPPLATADAAAEAQIETLSSEEVDWSEFGPDARQLIEACLEVLPADAALGLLDVASTLDEDDLRMAVFAHLIDAGVEDPEEFLKVKGILE